MLRIKRCSGTYKDYDIIIDNKIVGLLQLIDDTSRDYTFIRQIEVYEPRKGIATQVVDELVKQKTVRLCVATESESAVKFWEAYLKDKNCKNIRGTIWEIYK